MIKEVDIVKLVFGLKVQHLRKSKALSYQQLSEQTGLAISYLHNIEKGKKYPKADKIFTLAKALDTDYNYLVSLDADKKLQPIIDLLKSDFLKIFPLAMFGINTSKLLELLSQTPDRVNAFVSTVIKIIRNYNLQGEDFYKAALRSFQDLHHNYFEDIELAVKAFCQKNKLDIHSLHSTKQLESLLLKKFAIQINRNYLAKQKDLKEIRSFYSPEQRVLYLNAGFSSGQENFLIAKEIGYQVLKIEDRPLETRMLEVESFDKLLNNFKASYFSVAFLLGEEAMIKEVENMAKWERWNSDAFLGLLSKYNVTSEMLIQRLANILPRFFGINDLFFMRFFTDKELQKFVMTKEMHLSQLHTPHANQLDEHYCRRWISINLIRKLKTLQSIENISTPIADAQISRYRDTSNDYLCLCIAKASHHDPKDSVSVTLGLLINDSLKRLFPFLKDPALKILDVHNTCERCPISDCGARAVPPIALQYQKSKEKIKVALEVVQKAVKIKS